MLFDPLGMDSSSYRHADYEARENKALIHTRVGPAEDKRWAARYVRNADAEAPAGGLSSSVNDMVQFMRLVLGNGTVDGTELIDGDALQVTHVPHRDATEPTTPGVRTEFYGLGWNVTNDDQGRVQLDHSGAFLLGAGTTITLIEGEQLGIVTLTNGQPHGIPEAINSSLLGRRPVRRAAGGLVGLLRRRDARACTRKASTPSGRRRRPSRCRRRPSRPSSAPITTRTTGR